DWMRGGAGNDVYGVDNTRDVVDEGVVGSGGVDTVGASISFSLLPSAKVLGDVERLTLLGVPNINATGNALANTLTGNVGANIIDGLGNADTMAGRGGNDTY